MTRYNWITIHIRMLIALALCALMARLVQAQADEIPLTDLVPLEVGNQWTYKHRYLNFSYQGNWREQNPEIRMLFEIPGGYYHPPDSLRWGERELTIEITHTEMIDGLEYFVFSHADGGSTWQPDWMAIKDSDAETTGHTVSGLTNGTTYTFAVRAVNRVGKGAARAATATPVPSNRSPTLSGPATATTTEHSTGTIGPYEASEPDNDTLTWSLRGADGTC